MLKWTLALILAAAIYQANAQPAGDDKAKAAGPKTFYQMTFVVKELDGERVVNSRTYYTSAGTQGASSSIRAGEKVPFAQDDGNPVKTWIYRDVGVSIDCRDLELVGDRLSLRVSATVDGVAAREEKTLHQPVIRNNRWDSVVIVPLKQPTVIFSSDDPFSTQKIQLQVTATPMR